MQAIMKNPYPSSLLNTDWDEMAVKNPDYTIAMARHVTPYHQFITRPKDVKEQLIESLNKDEQMNALGLNKLSPQAQYEQQLKMLDERAAHQQASDTNKANRKAAEWDRQFNIKSAAAQETADANLARKKSFADYQAKLNADPVTATIWKVLRGEKTTPQEDAIFIEKFPALNDAKATESFNAAMKNFVGPNVDPNARKAALDSWIMSNTDKITSGIRNVLNHMEAQDKLDETIAWHETQKQQKREELMNTLNKQNVGIVAKANAATEQQVYNMQRIVGKVITNNPDMEVPNAESIKATYKELNAAYNAAVKNVSGYYRLAGISNPDAQAIDDLLPAYEGFKNVLLHYNANLDTEVPNPSPTSTTKPTPREEITSGIADRITKNIGLMPADTPIVPPGGQTINKGLTKSLDMVTRNKQFSHTKY